MIKRSSAWKAEGRVNRHSDCSQPIETRLEFRGLFRQISIPDVQVGRPHGDCGFDTWSVRQPPFEFAGSFLAALRNAGLVEPSASDEDVKHTLQRAKDEHAQIPEPMQVFNTPRERVRVFLGPYLTPKGRLWAEPLVSLELSDCSPD